MSVSGPNSNQPTYRQEFDQGVELFEKSFKAYQQSNFDPQKNEYALAMKDSLEVMQDAAGGMFNQHLMDMKSQLAKDMNAYMKNPSEENRQKVDSDIDSLKNQ